MATGTGKTRTASQIIRDRQTTGNALFLVHRDELINQFRDSFGEPTGKIKADESVIMPVTCGSVQTMSRRHYDPDTFSTVIVDEAHHSVSDSYLKVLNQFPAAKVLGLTATPTRSDKRELSKLYDGIAYEYGLRQAVNDGYLCPLVARTVPLDIDLSGVKVTVGDFELSGIAETLRPYLDKIADAIKEYAADRKTIVFLPLVSISQEFAEILRSKGIDAREVNGNSPDRTETLEWFKDAGKGSVLCNAMLLTEGYDCPSIDCVVVLRPTKVSSLYSQMIGRGTRVYPGKKNLLILDFLWMTTKHDLCRPATLATTNVEEVEHVKRATTSDELDLFDAVTDAVEARRNALTKELEKQKKKKAKFIDPLQYFVSIDAMDLEDYEPVFAWERQPASDRQIDLLKKFNINPDNITKGQASKIIDTLIARQKQGMATPKQVLCLERFGYERVGEWTFEQANKKIGALASVGWKRYLLRD